MEISKIAVLEYRIVFIMIDDINSTMSMHSSRIAKYENIILLTWLNELNEFFLISKMRDEFGKKKKRKRFD